MKKLIYIISAVLLLVSCSGVKVSGTNTGSCWDGDFNDCKVKAEQGDARAQFNLGWMYHKGEGIPQDYVMAHMFCNLAAASSSGMGAGVGARCRGVVAKKMSSSQIQEAQRLAREWMQKYQR